MIKHIVAWQFADEAEGRDRAGNVALVAERLRALVGVVPGIREFEVVVPQEGLEATVDLLLVSSFDDAQALQAYVVHTAHQEVAKLIAAVRRERHCVDYDPAVL